MDFYGSNSQPTLLPGKFLVSAHGPNVLCRITALRFRYHNQGVQRSICGARPEIFPIAVKSSQRGGYVRLLSTKVDKKNQVLTPNTYRDTPENRVLPPLWGRNTGEGIAYDRL